MPQNYNYASAISLISPPRISSYQTIFNPANDGELYGVYVWAQHAAGALYPLTQNAEISLRNAIDNVATLRFGQFWWRLAGFNGYQTGLFQRNIREAEQKLCRSWEDKERKRLNLTRSVPIPTPVPTWRHEQIIGATDFSTWQFILHDAFASQNQNTHSNYLWPLSMSDVFKQFSTLSTSPTNARKQLVNIIKEIRDYRNRLFHHEPIWIKDPNVVNARTAIETIRRKINKIENLLRVIEPRKCTALDKVGVFFSARRVCSEAELDIYRYANREPCLTTKKKRVLRDLAVTVKNNNTTAAWSYGGAVYGFYRIR